jgi:type IV pilus assembly protein PilC
MMEYVYEALDRSGKQIKGTMDATSDEVIVEKLRDMGFYPLRVSPHRAKHGSKVEITAWPVLKWIFQRIKTRHIMTFTRQLATLIDAGLPIMRSLAILREQVESAMFKDRIRAMVSDIESGASLSEAMAKHPRVFDKLYVNMVRAGEIGGVLEAVLNKVAEFLEKREALKSKVKSAMMYPFVVMCLAGGIVTFILLTIVPKFQGIFGQLGGTLPRPTQLLIDLSDILVHETWILCVAIALIVMIFKLLNKHPNSKYYLDRIKLRIPVFGELFKKIAITRFAGTLSTLINAGVPILQALDIVRDSSGNEVIARAMTKVHQSVRDGETIHEPLSQCDIFPPLVVHMMAVGEETGAIDLMLVKVAETYEREVDDTVNALTSILEPVLIVCLGALVGGIVVALYLPLFNVGVLIK